MAGTNTPVVPTSNSLLGADFGFSSPGSSGGENPAAELQFQSFTHQTSIPLTSDVTTIPIATSSNTKRKSGGTVVDLDEDDFSLGQSGDRESLLPGAQRQNGRVGNAPMWDLAYWAQYFDITSDQVIKRALYSVAPGVGLSRVRPITVDPLHDGSGPDKVTDSPERKAASSATYIDKHIANNPDLWGPFWISATLVFSIAVFGNMASYLASGGTNDHSNWHYDFTKVAAASSTIFLYITLVPLILWFFSWFRGCSHTYSLLETVCAYGYSLSIYIPISLVWVIQWRPLQYGILLVGAILSGSVLVHSFAPVVQSDPARTIKSAYALLIVIIAVHSLLALSFLNYFF